MSNWSKKTITNKLAGLYVAMLKRGIVIEKLSVFNLILKELGISERYFRKAVETARASMLSSAEKNRS